MLLSAYLLRTHWEIYWVYWHV